MLTRLGLVLLALLVLVPLADGPALASVPRGTPAAPVALQATPVSFQPRTSTVVLDTTAPSGGGRLAANEIRKVSVSQLLPAGGRAVAVNLVASNPAGRAVVTAWSCSGAPPVVPTLLGLPRQARAAGTVVPVASGRFCVTSSAATDLRVELQGVFATTAHDLFTPVGPVRLLDTRGANGRAPLVPAGTTTPVTIAPSGGTTTAALLSVTALGSRSAGAVTVAPCDSAGIGTQEVAYAARGAATNLAHVRVPADGRVCVTATTPVHVLVDLQGVYRSNAPGAWLQLAVPSRVLDTATGTGGWTGRVTASQTLTVASTLPPNAVAALATVTTRTPVAAGVATLGAAGTPVPPVGGVSYVKASTTSAPTLTRFDAAGRFALRATGRPSVAVDIVGWYAPVPLSSAPAPAVSTSHYISNNTGDPVADRAAARQLACAQAQHEHGGLVVLAFGSQRAGGTKKYHDANTILSYDDVRATATGWVEGLASCATPGATYTVAITTNNFGGTTDWNGAAGGVQWAQLVEQVAAGTAGQSVVTVAGGNDLEPGWGPPSQARAWLDAYLGVTPRLLYNTGSADQCPPQWAPEKPCANGWSMGYVYYAATGASPRVLMVPEIYTPNGYLASQWARLSRWGVDHGQGRLRVGGVLTEQGACQQVGGCTAIDLAPADGWAQLWGALNADPRTATEPTGFLTDIAWTQP